MYLLLPITIVAFLVIRWWAIRRVRFYERGDVASRLLSRIFARTPIPPMRRAILEEGISWLLAGLAVLAFFAVLFAVAMIFGPFRPIHEWVR